MARHAELSQIVLSAVRSAAEAGRMLPPVVGARYEFRHILQRVHRLLFRSKVRLVADTARQLVGFPEIQLVHAHSLFHDGAVALNLWRSHGIPYLAAVRNVDLHAFMRLGRICFSCAMPSCGMPRDCFSISSLQAEFP